jgi:hypothetical protein
VLVVNPKATEVAVFGLAILVLVDIFPKVLDFKAGTKV